LGRNLPYTSSADRDKTPEFQADQRRGTNSYRLPTWRQRLSGAEVSPAQWNLALAAFLVEKTYSLFATMLFAGERFKLTTGERVKGMGDAKLL
jgi:hypothetical protein